MCRTRSSGVAYLVVLMSKIPPPVGLEWRCQMQDTQALSSLRGPEGGRHSMKPAIERHLLHSRIMPDMKK